MTGKTPCEDEIRLDTEKKKLTDNENEVDGEIPEDDEGDMDEDEVTSDLLVRFRQRFLSLRQRITSSRTSIPAIARMTISTMKVAMGEISFFLRSNKPNSGNDDLAVFHIRVSFRSITVNTNLTNDVILSIGKIDSNDVVCHASLICSADGHV